MSTDIYGVRVLDVDPKELRVRFKVFAVYYDTGSQSCPPVPDDPGFFFFLLWEAARPHASMDRRGPFHRRSSRAERSATGQLPGPWPRCANAFWRWIGVG